MPHEDRQTTTRTLAQRDLECLWHPFTQTHEWQQHDPLVIASAEGAFLIDQHGTRYLDAVSSLWCNLHGHGHPALTRAIVEQTQRLTHSTFLGLTHEPGILLAERLLAISPRGLSRVFYSDDGSTALEAAAKIAFQYHQQKPAHDDPTARQRTTLAALTGAYHGDTLGTVSLGGISLFHHIYKPLLFSVARVASPALPRSYPPRNEDDDVVIDPSLPFGDIARRWPATAPLIDLFIGHGATLAALVIEPIVQAAAGFLTHPPGYLALARRLCTEFGVLLIVDEVATGFGRTGKIFACEHESVHPDILCVAKGITGGTLPLAATLVSEAIFDEFTAPPAEGRTFFHGHTYTANPVACAAALANLDLFEAAKYRLSNGGDADDANELLPERLLMRVNRLSIHLDRALAAFRDHPQLTHTRQVGFIAAADIVDANGQPFDPSRRIGHHVCMRARDFGLFVRPLGDTLVIMPPYCFTEVQIDTTVTALCAALDDVVSSSRQRGVERSSSAGPFV